ncbi:TrmB family transcriptional regulator [Halomicrobium sp. LC1Hm]|uniref:TrmB family transcriptional regulator n=1 Tax=Halomicrobium sp. LC1Hm TaxID=2610902 RepID=UPI0012983045|nr:TrmB family transcriptional regulator sugar-binding domain-containing protein [Halomicrobium sp. LC1Hm]QGA81362.1 Sugar-specific transcriptional regulator TrmB [Halomicrobium sp. LC1Hm]
MGESQIRETLSAFGLSTKEVDAYLAILQRGEATTRAVSEAAGVSQSYVYEIATALAERGLVIVDESATPTKLRARPPQEAVDALSMHLSEFETAVESVYDQPAETAAGFEVVHASQTVERRLERQLARAEREVFAIVPSNAFPAVADALADARERGLTVYCLLAGESAESHVAEMDDPGRYAHVVRSWDGRPPLFVVRDALGGVLASHGMLTSRHGRGYALAFNQNEVASGFFGNYVSNVWPMGEQRFVAEPPTLPATFELFRSGVTAAALHTTAGHDVVADLDVVATTDETARQFEGVPIREVRQNLVEPVNNAFPIENSLVVETDDGLVSVGGQACGLGPYYEEYAAREVTIRDA